MDEHVRQALRRLPGVDELLAHDELAPHLDRYPREHVVEALRAALETARGRLLSGEYPETWGEITSVPTIVREAGRLLESWARPHLRRVLNASGVVIHTNLGRSTLAPAALERVVEVARHYNNLEYDLEAGVRGSRHDHVAELLTRLTGAEAALVVNNNAGATLLMLAGLAGEGEVVVSRGQLVEIGGSFRIPDIMRMSGCRLVEVGTTNKTRIDDYRAALTTDTTLLLRVHTSNFKVVGFTEETSIAELVELGREWGVPVADDLGSGALVDLPAFRDEPPVTASLRAGADVVSFSGDKLLGGPQAGILLGTHDAISRLKKHPLTRALRVDKMTLAALEGTLQLYRDPAAAVREIPTLRFLDRSPAETEALAAELLAALEARFAAAGLEAPSHVEPSTARAGGGSLPLLELASHAVVVRPGPGVVVSLEAALREASVPVVGRVAQDALLLDVLALESEELPLVAESVAWALARSRCMPDCDPAPEVDAGAAGGGADA
ncbi:MAG: L-seryl-tRNA(Sec) selenium transferase [Actinobacteria bacterium]|nr:L-seryl-tRNA(Sec) selenium transferase [Actinomycetota bacterium]